jgi:hypothetical protein
MQNLGLLLRECSSTADEGNRKGIRGNACLHAHGFLPEAFIDFVIDYILRYRL